MYWDPSSEPDIYLVFLRLLGYNDTIMDLMGIALLFSLCVCVNYFSWLWEMMRFTGVTRVLALACYSDVGCLLSSFVALLSR